MHTSVGQIKALSGELKAAFPSLQCRYLFGSEAAGKAKPGSDIDLAAFVDERGGKSDPLLNIDMACFCEKKLGRPVDFIIMNRASPVLQHEALSTGIRLYGADSAFRAIAEAHSFRDYLDAIYHLEKRTLMGLEKSNAAIACSATSNEI